MAVPVRPSSLILLLAGLWLAPALAAQPQPVSPDLLVPQETRCNQNQGVVSTGPAGDFVVAWSHEDPTGKGRDVVARLFDRDGSPRSPEIPLNVHRPGWHDNPAVARMPDGGFVAVWSSAGLTHPQGQDGESYGVFGRLFDAAGQPRSGEFQVNVKTAGQQHAPRVEVDAAGRILVLWVSADLQMENKTLLGRRFDASGQPLGGEIEIATEPTLRLGYGNTYYDFALDPDGSFVAVWTDATGTGFFLEVRARRFNASGAPTTGDFPVDPGAPGTQENPRIVKVEDGWFVVWRSGLPGEPTWTYSLRGRHLRPSGFADGAVVEIHPGSDVIMFGGIDLAPLSGGGFIAAWSEWGRYHNPDIQARQFDASGQPRGEAFRVNGYTDYIQDLPSVASQPGGAFVAAWTSQGEEYGILPPSGCLGQPSQDGADDGVFARRFLASGAPGSLLLNDDRFQVEVTWTDPFNGGSGIGTARPVTADTGAFWFFGPDNLELMVKVLDGRSYNGHFWVFWAGLSNVEYRITATDRLTGEARTYHNPPYQFGSGSDIRAFAASGSTTSAGAVKASAATGLCAGPTVLCLNGDRFRAEVTWKSGSRTGTGTAVPITADTGAFWFFGAENLELMVKVLDGRSYNGRFWVFYGGLTDVEFTLTVTDSVTGASRTYHNPASRMASAGDTAAF